MEPLQETNALLGELLSQTSRHVDIASPQLEPALLDSDAVGRALAQLARRGRHTRIRILLRDFSPEQFAGHRLLAVAGRLTTAITVRGLEAHPEWADETWVICDGLDGLLLKTAARSARRFHGRPEAKRLTTVFERLWLASEPIPELCRF